MKRTLRWAFQHMAIISAFLLLAQPNCPSARAGLIVNVSFDSTFTDPTTGFGGANLASAEAAVNYAAQQFQNLFSDPVQINMTFSGSQGTSILGQSSFTLLGSYNYSTIKTDLLNDAKSANDASTNATLPVSNPTGSDHYFLARAQAKALGVLASDSTNDGTVTIGNGFTYTFDPNNRALSGKIDFIGVVEHEMSEVMGRVPGLGKTTGGFTSYRAYDLFRYSALGTRDFTNGNNLYFSINDGATDLKNFNFPNGNGSDPQDWASGSNDAFNAFSSSGVKNDITAVDIQAMDVIGYDLASIPEPSSYILLGLTFAVALSGYCWRRHKQQAAA